MAVIYTNSQPTFGMTSTWRCNFYVASGRIEWYITATPTSSSQTVTFPVVLPADAVVTRAWLTMGLSTSISGSAYQRVNGISIPSSGEVTVDGITAATTAFQAAFEFRANGIVYQDTQLHEGRLSILDPTLHVEYNAVSEPDDGGDGETVIVSRPLDTGVQLPRLLNADFREVARIDPSNLRLEINLDPKSAAMMRVPPGEPEAHIGDFLELFSPHGSVGLFRVIEAERRLGLQEETTYRLEHAISTLEDSLAIGTQSMSAPVATVIATLLESQNVRHWVLGDCEVPEDVEVIYEYSYQNLLAAIMGITASLPPEYYWEFDTLRHPFVMHLRRLPEADGCEMRMRRNLTYVTLTIDRSQLCTRLYPFGAGEGTDRVTLAALTGSQHIDSDTAATWGYVSRTITAPDVYDSPTLKLVAERYLERYGAPKVSVVGEAVDLSEMTGERLDYFRVGVACQLALPDYGVTMRERVITTAWPDVYNQPLRLDVMMSSRIRDAADEIAELMREATNSKLVGGTVETIEETARAGSITPGSPFAQSFDVTGYGNVLNVKTSYRVVTASGEEVNAHITVDGNAVDDTDAAARVVDITRYLSRDDAGVPTVGTHKVVIQPATVNTVTSEVDNTITIKQIGKR